MLPTIQNTAHIVLQLKQWQAKLNGVLRNPNPLRSPVNFRAASASSATNIALSWDAIPNADGYEIESSTNGDFSAFETGATPIVIGNGTQTTYSDAVGAASQSRWYRIRATSSVNSDRHASKGTWTAPIKATSGSGTTVYDQVSHAAGWNVPGRVFVAPSKTFSMRGV